MRPAPSTAPINTEELLQQLHTIIVDAEKLLGRTLSESVEDNRSRLRERLAAAQNRLADLYAAATGKVWAGAKRADQTVRSHPYEAMALALGVGVLLGILLRRQGTD